MSKSIQIMAIAVAFVAVTLVSGVVYADDKNGKPFEAIWEAIHNLESTSNSGIIAIDRVDMAVSVPTPFEVTVPCMSGDTVLSGGYDIPLGVTITADRPADGDTGWLVGFKHSSDEKVVTVYAICATVIP